MTDRSWTARFAAIADKPGDDAEERLRHRLMLVTAVAMSCGGLLWGIGSLLLGLRAPAVIPFGYTLITAINLAVLAATRRFALARAVQILISLLLPFFFQWSLGGFVSSGCMMVWALLSLVAALSFDDARQAGLWLVLFLALTAASSVLEGRLVTPEVLEGSTIGGYVFGANVATVTVAVFGLTYYFSFARHEALVQLRAKNREIAEGQAALIQSEKMAALGQLVAGVAHELNTPLGAIRASAGNLSVALDRAIEGLPELLHRVSDGERAEWSALVGRTRAASQPLGSSDERKARRQLARVLDEMGVADPEVLAETLVELGVVDPAPHRAMLTGPHAAELIEGAYDVTSLHRNTENIRVAADRAAKIVFALKSHAHPGSAAGRGEPSAGSLSESLDTVLTLYQNLSKRGVEVVRDYVDVGAVVARHDELAQVWTNLVHNALQAMDGKGTLTVRVRADGADSVVVEVGDTGPGIPEALRERIFEPFFTTKAKGEGTGLGLSICREILERHGGRLDLSSEPGHTVFTARLPRCPPRPSGAPS